MNEPSEETPTDYAEDTGKSTAQDAVATASNVTLETARLSYAKFRAIQNKRQQTAAALGCCSSCVIPDYS